MEVDVPELDEGGEVRGEWTGESVEAEAEGPEGGEVTEHAGGDLADETSAGKAEDDDAPGLADDSLPGARRDGFVPGDGELTHGLPKP